MQEAAAAIVKNRDNVQQAYQMLSSPALMARESAQRVQPTTVSPQGYLQALQAGAAIQAMCVQPATQQHRDKAVVELQQWLQKGYTGRDLQQCIPEDIVVYLTSWWIEQHGGCTAHDGSKFAAPVSLEALLSHLAIELEKQGCCGEYDVDSHTGNPIRSGQLRRFKQGYRRFAEQQGYKQKSARPWKEREVRAVLEHLSKELKRATGMEAALLSRDGFVIAVLWETKSRGCNAGAWRLANIKLPTGNAVVQWNTMRTCTSALEAEAASGYVGESAIPFIYPIMGLAEGAVLALQPDRTKTGSREPMQVEIRRDIMCTIGWLNAAMKAAAAVQQPITNFLSRPQTRDKQGFQERGLTAPEVAGRVTVHMAAAKIPGGHLVHGARRGSMQEAYFNRGMTVAEVGAAAGIKTPAIVQRYLDPFRHIG